MSDQPHNELESLGYQLLRWSAYALAVFSPLLMTLFFMHCTLGADLFDPSPVWNDELIYWHGVATFREVGFNGGYYTFDELPAKASFTHFDAHGPVFYVFLGILSALAEWTPGAAVVWNLIFIAAATALLLLASRPGIRDTLLIAAVLATSWVIPLFVPIAMQESLHHAIGILIAAFLIISLRLQKPPTLPWQILFILLVLFAGLMRPLWTFTLLPLFYLWSSDKNTAVKAGYAALAFAIIAFTFKIFVWFGAPYPETTFSAATMSLLGSDPLLAISQLLQRPALVFQLIGKGLIVEVSMRQQILLLIGLALFWLYQSRKNLGEDACIPRKECIVLLLNLLVLALFLFALHDIFDLRDYRTFAPHLLCAVLVLALQKRSAPCLLIILLNITTMSSALDTFRDFHTRRYTAPRTELVDFTARSANFLKYDPHQTNAWCNTVLTQAVSGYQFSPVVNQLEPGIGFSVILNNDRLMFPLQSRFLLIDDARAELFRSKMRIERLQDFGHLKLYRNLEAGCLG